jgi:hypothetical protein
MPHIRLPLPDNKVDAAISMATESHLQQAHYLLAATILVMALTLISVRLPRS